MKASEFIKKKKYSEGSGTNVIVDDNLEIKLNEYGIYEENILSDKVKRINSLVKFVSPNLNSEVNESDISDSLYAEIDGINYDQRLGYFKTLYAGHVAEGSYRDKASSGGMGTWIFKELFERNLIDGVIHVKDNKDNNSSTMFKYDISRTLEEIREGAKTKYYPVELSEVINKVKKIPGKYAVIGIPSFIMAIRLLAEKDDVIKERIKYTVGLVCGHQKSSKFAEALAWQVGIEPGNLKHIDFRKKLLDKPANNYGVQMTGIIDGEEVTIVKPTKELVGQNWGQGFFKVKASDFTDDVMAETADITLGDAWLPEYTKDSKGNNIVIVRHPEIDVIVKEGMESNKLNLDIVDKETMFRSQAAHYRHTHDELAYRLYRKDKKNQWRPLKRVEASKDIPYLRRRVQDLRKEISEKSHIAYKEAVELNDLDYFINEMNNLSLRYKKVYRLISIRNLGFIGIIKKVFKKLIGR